MMAAVHCRKPVRNNINGIAKKCFALFSKFFFLTNSMINTTEPKDVIRKKTIPKIIPPINPLLFAVSSICAISKILFDTL